VDFEEKKFIIPERALLEGIVRIVVKLVALCGMSRMIWGPVGNWNQ
jgi:hypothetical protein